MTAAFTPAQRAALRELADLWPSRPFVLVGASAIECQRPMRRATADLDLTVAASMEEFPAGLDRLPGWRRHPLREHEWTGPGRVQIDIIPADNELLSRGSIEWPGGHRMNLTGLGHAFAHFIDVAVDDAVTVKVATLPVIALLKMVAYLDRPVERRHDLEDLAFLIEEVTAVDDERLWSAPVIEAQLPFEIAGAFVLGVDIGAFAGEADLAIVNEFATWAHANRFATTSEMARVAPPGWRKDEDGALARVEALAAGVRSSRGARMDEF